MEMHTIGDVARRSGFSPSALRFYERRGIVAPAARSENGYRLYDGQALDRLGFVARAKQLGCSLDEIADLVDVWEGGECEPVQRRLHELVTAKMSEARRQVRELTTLTRQLEAAAANLGEDPAAGPCGAGCACVGAQPTHPVAVALGRRSAAAGDGDELVDGAPIACSLPAHEVAGRLDAWKGVLDRVRRRTNTAEGHLRIELDGSVRVDELARLVADEQACCRFFSFSITVDDRGVGLEVAAPTGAGDLVDILFGVPA